ncbi:hypothetical protein, partial [Pseudomonas sp. FEN]
VGSFPESTGATGQRAGSAKTGTAGDQYGPERRAGQGQGRKRKPATEPDGAGRKARRHRRPHPGAGRTCQRGSRERM